MDGSGWTTGVSVAEVGEKGVLEALTGRWHLLPEILLGPGDDAALIRAGDGRVVATTDLLVEGRHFQRAWSTPVDVGRRAAAQNFADIAAMGARPTALLVGVAMPGELALVDLLGIADGLQEECERAGGSVAGGDLVREDHLVLAVTALGDLGGRDPVRRSGARPGDVVVLSGNTGWSAAGLALLMAGHDSPGELIDAYRCPQPPYAHGPRLAVAGATAMCDVSDGLLRDLGNIAMASRVRIEVDVAALEPADVLMRAATTLGVDARDWTLTGGEDHALVACLPANVAVPRFARVIGRVVAASPAEAGQVTAGGHEKHVTGWDSFRSPSGQVPGVASEVQTRSDG